MLKIRSSRLAPVAIFVASTALLIDAQQPSYAASTSLKTTTVKTRRATKRTTPRSSTSTVKVTPTTIRLTTTTLAPSAQVRVGYEAYLSAFVAAAREPEKAPTLLAVGMTGAALTQVLELRRLDAQDGVYWDGTRKDIVSGPTIEAVGDTTATLRDCRSVGGVLRQKATGAVVPGTSEPDVDDTRVTLVRLDGKWIVTATERFNDVEGRSRCKPGAPPSS